MPRRKQPVHSYSVYITAWVSLEIKETEQRVSSADQLETRTLYRGSSERQAAWHFYRGAQEAMQNPLVISVFGGGSNTRRRGAPMSRVLDPRRDVPIVASSVPCRGGRRSRTPSAAPDPLNVE